MGEDHGFADAVQGGLDESDEPIAEEPRDKEPNRQVNRGVDDALAQFVQMLHQAHAWEFRAF